MRLSLRFADAVQAVCLLRRNATLEQAGAPWPGTGEF